MLCLTDFSILFIEPLIGSMILHFMLLQVLHSAVVKQVEIANLLENLEESRFHVSLFAKTFLSSYSIPNMCPRAHTHSCWHC